MPRTATLTALLLLLSGCAFDVAPDAELVEDETFVPDAPAENEDEDQENEGEKNQDEENEDEENEDEENEDEDEDPDPLEAEHDGDTFDAPLFEFSFQGSGARTSYTVTDDVSAPSGDREDWVAFRSPAPQNNGVYVSLDLQCDGDDGIRAEIWDDEQGPTPLGATWAVRCGEVDDFYLDTAHDYLVRLHFPNGEQGLVDWELTVSR